MSQATMTTKEAAAHKAAGIKNLTYLRDKHKEKVKGIFRFHEVPGGEMSLVFREFKGEKPQRYQFYDGEIYEIPLGLAKHLNRDCWYPEYDYLKGDGTTGAAVQAAGVRGGTPVNQGYRITRKVRRCSFQSLEFLDIDELPSGDKAIIQVEHA